MTRKKGFTLMELVIVVSILSVLFLISIAVLNPITSIDKAYDAHRKKDLKEIETSFENYYSDYSCYPTQADTNFCDQENLAPYLKKIPCDPSKKIPYEIVVEPAVCPQKYIAYTLLKRDNSCFSVSSPNTVVDPNYDCSLYINSFVPPTGTPTPTPPSGTPTPTPTGTPTPTPPSGTPTPTPTPTPFIQYSYCSSLDNCTDVRPGNTCPPHLIFTDSGCNGACSDPANICF